MCGGSGGGGNTQYNWNSDIAPYWQGQLRQGQSLSQTPYQQYQGQRIANLDPNQNVAMQGIRNYAMNPQSSLYGQGASSLASTLNGNFLQGGPFNYGPLPGYMGGMGTPTGFPPANPNPTAPTPPNPSNPTAPSNGPRPTPTDPNAPTPNPNPDPGGPATPGGPGAGGNKSLSPDGIFEPRLMDTGGTLPPGYTSPISGPLVYSDANSPDKSVSTPPSNTAPQGWDTTSAQGWRENPANANPGFWGPHSGPYPWLDPTSPKYTPWDPNKQAPASPPIPENPQPQPAGPNGNPSPAPGVPPIPGAPPAQPPSAPPAPSGPQGMANPYGSMGNPFGGMNSPYFNNALQSQLGEIGRQYQNTTDPETTRLFNLSGAFGGSAHQKAISNNQQDLAKQLGNVSAGMYNDQYNRSAGLAENQLSRGNQNFEDERNRMMQAAGLSQGDQGLTLQRMNALMGVGDINRGFNQDQLNLGYQNWQDQRQWPFQMQDYMSGLLSRAQGGVSPNSSFQQSGYSASPFSSIIGAGLLGSQFLGR